MYKYINQAQIRISILNMARLNRTKLDRNEADMKIFALFLYYLNLSISTRNVVEIKK